MRDTNLGNVNVGNTNTGNPFKDNAVKIQRYLLYLLLPPFTLLAFIFFIVPIGKHDAGTIRLYKRRRGGGGGGGRGGGAGSTAPASLQALAFGIAWTCIIIILLVIRPCLSPTNKYRSIKNELWTQTFVVAFGLGVMIALTLTMSGATHSVLASAQAFGWLLFIAVLLTWFWHCGYTWYNRDRLEYSLEQIEQAGAEQAQAADPNSAPPAPLAKDEQPGTVSQQQTV
ncbi:hypothetical protein CspeluHIS016_0406780 [Cutaneotrichosporon spelunceum]|uniref:Uncharacterized protein n=1 Tax=Cutaneotrichosporon spelunceum TaxID=1672016 RepID=A0AAD3TWN4_9TREE|nr:hypothetical protein CspeluHIS016_0406780 [Cutaneotrichosporon spelunceum]